MTGGRRERGVTIVEAAFAIPILLMFMMGLIDLGLWAFNSNQATNAARDGARAGIIDFQQADVPHSDDWKAIVARVEERLPGRTISADDIEIRCVRADGGSGCAGAHPEQDSIQVEVDWGWPLLTPIAGVIGVAEGEASGSATMRLLGRPGDDPPATPPVEDEPTPSTSSTTSTTTTTSPPGDCEVTGLVVSPTMPKMNGADMLEKVTVTFTATGGEGCSGLAVQMTPDASTQVLSATCDSCASATQKWTYSSNDKVWKAGPASLRIFNSNVDHLSSFVVTG